jgi:uncharacterized Zn finger protein
MFCNKCQCEKDTSAIVKKYNIPFKCEECGSIKFPYKAMNGIVFVWSEPKPEKIGSIFMPSKLNEPYATNIAVVLSSGPGVYEKGTKKYIPSLLKPGDLIMRDKTTPWIMDIEATDGKMYSVAYMNLLDIWVRYEEEEEIKSE